jgi:hypothetical protein
MSNEIDIYDGGGGELQPYSPSQPLAPAPSPDWGRTDVDVLTQREIDDYQGSGSVQLFGQPIPPGTTPQQIQQVLGEAGGIYLSDFSKLGHPHSLTQAAIQFFMTNATKPPQQVRRHHAFNLHDQAGDWLAESFGNYLHSLGGTQAQKQKFLSDSLWWLGELNKRLGASQGKPAQGRAPISSANPLGELTDAQFDVLIKHNDQVKAQTMGVIQDKYGKYSANQVIDIAQKYLASLPARDQAHFDQWTGSWPWVHMLNTVEALEGLYNMAIGAGSLPTSGAEIAREIASIENVMKTERKKYLADNQLQARYRTLLGLRGN